MKKLFGRTHALLALAVVLAPTLVYGRTTPAAAESNALLAHWHARRQLRHRWQSDHRFRRPYLARSVAVQPDGKIVVAGVAFITGDLDFVLARYE